MLSDDQCRDLVPNGKKIVKVHDGGGLYLWLYGERKCWRMRYWLAGKEKSLSLGVYPAVTLDDARAKRGEIRALLDRGIDPSLERREARMTADEYHALAFRLSFDAQGAITIETGDGRIALSRPQTEALRAFLATMTE